MAVSQKGCLEAKEADMWPWVREAGQVGESSRQAAFT